jgi:hypothetical protein
LDACADEALHVLATSGALGRLLRRHAHLRLRESVARAGHLLGAGLRRHGPLLRHDLWSGLHGRAHVARALLHGATLRKARERLLRALLLRERSELCRRSRAAFRISREAVDGFLPTSSGAALFIARLVQAEESADALGDCRRKQVNACRYPERNWIDRHGYS